MISLRSIRRACEINAIIWRTGYQFMQTITMENNTSTPKVFISYSWTSTQHQTWVINLAERLVSDGVDVVIDKWDLKEGHDLFSFMESMVSSPEINKVLIVLDKKYSEKANGRVGGVGTETQIISPQIYNKVDQDKFIPLVTELDESGIAWRPAYLKSSVFIDFSNAETFELPYEQLLRNIYKRPALSKPKLGKAPSYLFENTAISFQTSLQLRVIESTIINYPTRLNSSISDFFDAYLKDLAEMKLKFSETTHLVIGKEIVDSINQYTPLRNDFIHFMDKITNSRIGFDIDLVTKFFEKMHIFKNPTEGVNIYAQNDNYKFIIHELFIYIVAIFLKNERYELIEDALLSRYFIQDRSRDFAYDGSDYHAFYDYINSIDNYYNTTFSRNFISPMAELIVTRIPEGLNKDILIEADLICHYIGDLHDITWFPITYIYKTRGQIDFFKRLISQRHFEKMKGLFGVKSPSELKAKLNSLQESSTNQSGMRYPNSFETILPIYKLVDIDKIASAR